MQAVDAPTFAAVMVVLAAIVPIVEAVAEAMPVEAIAVVAAVPTAEPIPAAPVAIAVPTGPAAIRAVDVAAAAVFATIARIGRKNMVTPPK